MTDEELDRARAEEAFRRLLGEPPIPAEPMQIAELSARLAREDWQPEEPLAKAVREIAEAFDLDLASVALWGASPKTIAKMIGVALRRGIEIGKGQSVG